MSNGEGQQVLHEHPGTSSISSMGCHILCLVSSRMDAETRASWRLANKAACQAVYEATKKLSPCNPHGSCITALPVPLLAKCSSLTELSCNGLRHFHNLAGLPHDLEDLDIGVTAVTDLTQLRHCTALTSLIFPHPVIPLPRASYLQHLPSILLQLPQLCVLDLTNHDMGAAAARQLASALRLMTNLQELELHGNALGVAGAQALAPAIEMLSGLHTLGLGSNGMGAEGIIALAPALMRLGVLQHPGPSDDEVRAGGASDAPPSAQPAASPAPAPGELHGLEYLDISNNVVGVDGAAALLPALEQLTRLRFLQLDGNQLGADGVRALAPALQQLTGLQTLYLQYNNLGAEGALALASALSTLPQLEQLYIWDNDLSPENEAELDQIMQFLVPECEVDFEEA